MRYRAVANKRDPIPRGCVHLRARMDSGHCRRARRHEIASTATRNAIDATAQRWFAAQDAEAQRSTRRSVTSNTRSRRPKPRRQRRVVADGTRRRDLQEAPPSGYLERPRQHPLDSARRAAAHRQRQRQERGRGHRRAHSGRRRAEGPAERAARGQRAAQDKTLHDGRRRAHCARRPAREPARQTRPQRRHRAHRRSRSELTSRAGRQRPAAPTATDAGAAHRRGRRAVGAASNDGRVSPHHNDPFLVCTRAHESAGNYGVVSSTGYYGAYQFAPTTWDTTAVHAGRHDLVGVLPSLASPYDQDEMAWTLYQWQGNGPGADAASWERQRSDREGAERWSTESTSSSRRDRASDTPRATSASDPLREVELSR